jgi:ankyrin repeat protein
METLHGNLMETQAAPAFFLAALDGDAETVSKMLSTAGAQSLINYQHALGDTPLLTALGATPLLAAAANGHVAVTEQLLEARCNVDLQMQGGVSPLHCAAAKGHASVTKQLIVARCNVDVQKKSGATPLFIASLLSK